MCPTEIESSIFFSNCSSELVRQMPRSKSIRSRDVRPEIGSAAALATLPRDSPPKRLRKR